MTGDSKPQNTRKSGTRSGGRRGRPGVPRIMWVAILVIVAGAVLLFRQGGDDVPTGIGERRTVVTSEASYQSLDDESAKHTLGAVLKYREDQDQIRREGITGLVAAAPEEDA